MWFKQCQLFQLTSPMQSSANALSERLSALAFKPCLPSMPFSMGWVCPIEDMEDEEEAPLARGLNGCIMICLQMEEKILPASVVNKTLKEKIKQIELNEARKVFSKEKLAYKDDIVHGLLSRAFSKFTRLYAYIDTRTGWLILNVSADSKVESFIALFKKSLGDCIAPFETIKPASLFTRWLKEKNYPTSFSIEKSCVLQDPKQQNRIIRAEQQDLFADSIQSLVKGGCEVMQLALCWHDKVNFLMANNFSLRKVRLADDDLADIKEEGETKQQKFDADFILMTETFSGLIKELLEVFDKNAMDKMELTTLRAVS